MKTSLRNRISRSFGLSKSHAVRVQHWLHRMFDSQNLVHGDVSIVPYGQKMEGAPAVASIVGTVDYDQKALGCAWCGEWAADSGQPLQTHFKIVVLHPDWLPYDIRNLEMRPSVLYCVSCWQTHREHFVRGFDLDPESNP